MGGAAPIFLTARDLERQKIADCIKKSAAVLVAVARLAGYLITPAQVTPDKGPAKWENR